MLIPLPYWKEGSDAYEAPELVAGPKTPKQRIIKGPEKAPYSKGARCKGVKVDTQRKETPLVVDVKGGECDYWPVPDKNVVHDKATMDMLVLPPDGKLLSYNAGEDS